MIPSAYTLPVVLAVPVVVALELFVLRTGLFRTSAYWITLAIVTAFQIPVDGWLTKLSAPIVRYSPAAISGVRFPWDIPIEDFLFGFVLTTTTLMMWRAVNGERSR
jgi:lycopene cyclase domain-containing protein